MQRPINLQSMAKDDCGEATKARIRDAAITQFAEEGFAVGLRAIARSAGVTAGLITHYFGSKDALRHECDAYVLRLLRSWEPLRASQLHRGALEGSDDMDEVVRIVNYVARSLQGGGELAQSFVEQLVLDTRERIDECLAAGQIAPSDDEDGRARTLVMYAVGALLLEFTLAPPLDAAAVTRLFGRYYSKDAVPMVEQSSAGLWPSAVPIEKYLARNATPAFI